MDFPDFRPQVEEELRSVLGLGGGPPPGLSMLYSYHMGFCAADGKPEEGPRGKYLRPLLLLSMCSALGGLTEQALPAAASLELIHRTSLVFDDIQDVGRERNGRPTVWALWGQNQAINAGLALSCYGRIALQGMKARGVEEAVVLRVMEVLEKAVVSLCWGQYRDIAFMEGASVGVRDYEEMVEGKTAALFGAACEVGALLAGRPQDADRARDFGVNLGVAFQMRDDYLGVWGEEARVGKTANDLVEKKRSLPVVLALEEDPEGMESWLSPPEIALKDAAIIRDWMERRGIRERVQGYCGFRARVAREKLAALPLLPEWRERLQQLVQLSIQRDH